MGEHQLHDRDAVSNKQGSKESSLIISKKHQFIIATPTKNGTTSLQSMANMFSRHGGDPRVLQVFRGDSETKHRMAPPSDCYEFKRYIVVRDPRTRLPSMYEWLRRRPNDEPLGRAILDAEARRGGRVAGWNQMVRAFHQIVSTADYKEHGRRRLGARRPYMWTDNQSLLWDFLNGQDADGTTLPWWDAAGDGPEVLHTESLESDFHELLVDNDVSGVAGDILFELPLKQLNSTRGEDRLAHGWEEYWDLLDDEAADMFDALVALDLVEFGYQ